MAKIKKVGFNFFRPIIGDEDELFNFREIFEVIRRDYLDAKSELDNGDDPGDYKLIYQYNGEPARLSEISIDQDTQYYHLVFERLDYQVPARTTLHGESRPLELQDDEYIGVDVSVLYDPFDHIFMLQRNRSSLGPSGIEKFLKTIIHNYTTLDEFNFELAIVSDSSARRRAFRQSAYRKVHLKVVGAKANGIVEKFTTNRTEVDSVEIVFNSKQAKHGKIDEDFAKNLLEEYVESEDVKKLTIRAREQEDGEVEPIDLIDHKLQTFTQFDFRENRRLNPISVFERMVYKFDQEDGGFKNKVLRMG
ncbi:DUF6731 family protein [Gracilibacillus sp. HCP3S3_G5_1]|uniref:DUF6731 family protein n=1 Tax=unclassified Gracilibacillus TaxID=2625209 RepID=UPI003F8B62ED